MSYESTLAYIHAENWQRHRPGLARTRALLAALGDPQRQLRFIHIAGTNGKGSTAAMCDACLRAAGLKVGLFTSPYILRFNERFQVNGVPISDEALEAVTDLVRPAAAAMAEPPTEFELITAIGMLYFARQRCDIVVLEVGMGGGLDSTNVIDTPEAAVVTALGMDHVKELGPTLADIAAAKAGIFKPGGTAVAYGGVPEADTVLAAAAAAAGADLHWVDFSSLQIRARDLDAIVFDYDGLPGLRLPLLGSYQPCNAATAITTLRLLRQKGWPVSEQAIRDGLAQVSWPGRFELLRRRPPFLLDGSHNAHGMRATVKSLQDAFPRQKFTFLISIMADKDVDAMLDLLAPLAACCVTVAAASPRAMPAPELAGRLHARGVPAESCGSVEAGVARALALAKDGPAAALGTLYFSGEVRTAFARLTGAAR